MRARTCIRDWSRRASRGGHALSRGGTEPAEGQGRWMQARRCTCADAPGVHLAHVFPTISLPRQRTGAWQRAAACLIGLQPAHPHPPPGAPCPQCASPSGRQWPAPSSSHPPSSGPASCRCNRTRSRNRDSEPGAHAECLTPVCGASQQHAAATQQVSRQLYEQRAGEQQQGSSSRAGCCSHPSRAGSCSHPCAPAAGPALSGRRAADQLCLAKHSPPTRLTPAQRRRRPPGGAAPCPRSREPAAGPGPPSAPCCPAQCCCVRGVGAGVGERWGVVGL